MALSAIAALLDPRRTFDNPAAVTSDMISLSRRARDGAHALEDVVQFPLFDLRRT